MVDKYNFRAGDMIIDSVSGVLGILLKRRRMLSDIYNPSPLFIWEIAWFPPIDPTTIPSIWHPREYPEHTLMLSIEEGDLAYYACPIQKRHEEERENLEKSFREK